jgi:hypothetical protein
MTTLLALAILIFIGMIVAGTVHRVLLHLEEKRRRTDK